MTETSPPASAAATAPALREQLPRGFWRLWNAVGLSNLGDSVVFVASGLLVVTLTDDERLQSIVVATIFTAWVVMALPVGVLIDRLDRQRLMTGANLVRAFAGGTTAMLIVSDRMSIALLIVLLAVFGTCEVVFDSTGQALTTMVVPQSLLARANGLFFAAELIAGSIIGLALGAALFDIEPGLPFATVAVAYALGAALVLTVTLRHVPAVDLTAPVDRGLRGSVGWLWRHRLLRLLAGLTALGAVSYMLSVGVLAKYATVELGLTGLEYGILIAVNAIGAGTASLASEHVIAAIGVRTALLGSFLLTGAGLLVIGLLETVWAIAACYGAVGFFLMVWNVATLTIRQELIPPEQFGRVNGVYRWLTGISNVVGAVAGGFLAFATSLPMTFVIGGAAILSAGIVSAVPLNRALRVG